MTNKVSAYVDLVKSFYVALTLKSQERPKSRAREML